MDQTRLSLYNCHFHNFYDFVIKYKKIKTTYEDDIRVLNLKTSRHT